MMNLDHELQSSFDSGAGDPDSLSYCKLTVSNIGEILQLINHVWPTLYGKTGCPQFTEEYLYWLYAGPNSKKHFLLGCRLGGQLVGFKALLYRDVLYDGRELSAHIATHLSIEPSLPFGLRISIATEFSKPHTLSGEFNGVPICKGDLRIAFFEQGKALLRSVDKINRDAGLESSYIHFEHAIVNPRPLKAFVENGNELKVRKCVSSDAKCLANLLTSITSYSISLHPAPDTLWHHISKAPHGCAFAVEDHGSFVGFIAGYILTTIKENQHTKVLVIEFVVSESAEALGALLLAAVKYAESSGARGVVIENTTHLSPEYFRDLGIIPTRRQMALVITMKSLGTNSEPVFLVDIK